MRGYYKLANPGNPLRYNASGSALPVSGLAHSRGPEEDPFTSLTYSNIETRMDRPKSSKGHQGISVHVSRLFIGSSSGMYGIRYLRVLDYVSVSRFY